jgi:tetratricopeptide (TPR) repeat protein
MKLLRSVPGADKNRVTSGAALLSILFIGTAAAEHAEQGAPQISRSEAIARNNTAVRLAAEGRDAEAERLYRSALGARYDDDLVRAKIANNLAALYRKQDRYRDAERMFRSALEWRQKNLPSGSPDIAYSFNNLAEIYRVEGRDWEARNLMQTAVRSLEQSHADTVALPIILSNLAVVLCRFGEFEDAEELLRSALLSYQRQGLALSREYGIALNNLGQVLESKNDLEGAAPLYQRALGVFEPLGPSARTDLAATLANTGELYERLDRIEDARQAEQRALELCHPQGDEVLRSQILRHLGNIVANAGNPTDALPYFEQSLVIQEKTLGEVHPAMASLLLDYSSATLRAGKKSLSRKLRRRATDLLARLKSRSTDDMTVSVSDLRAAK